MHNSLEKNFIAQSKASNFINIVVEESFLDDKLQRSFGINDIFKTQQPYATTYINGTKQVRI